MDIVRPQRAAADRPDGSGPLDPCAARRAGSGRAGLGDDQGGAGDPAAVRTGWCEAAARRGRPVPRRGARPAPPTMVLPVDQAEELFGADAGEEAAAFLDRCGGLLRDGQPALAMVVVATVRSDRYEPLQTAPQLAGLEAKVFDDLKPMPPDRYREVICGPAGAPAGREPAAVGAGTGGAAAGGLRGGRRRAAAAGVDAGPAVRGLRRRGGRRWPSTRRWAGCAGSFRPRSTRCCPADPDKRASSWSSCMTRSSRGWWPSTRPTTSRCAGPPGGRTCPPTASL